jgi:hypothetical protein
MTTKTEKIAALKLEYPTIKTGSDEHGYTDLSQTDYETTLSEWADNMLADEAKAQAEAQAVIDKAALLAKLGITADEAKLLRS